MQFTVIVGRTRIRRPDRPLYTTHLTRRAAAWPTCRLGRTDRPPRSRVVGTPLRNAHDAGTLLSARLRLMSAADNVPVANSR